MTLKDMLPKIGSTAPLPSLLGTIPVLVVAASGMFIRTGRNHLTAPLLLLCGIVACWMSAIWLSGDAATSSIHLATIGLAFAFSFCAVLISFRQVSFQANREDVYTKEILSDLNKPVIPADAPSLDDILTTDLEETEAVGDGEIVQSWTRVRLADHTERLEGTIHLHFRAGEQIQHCHIPLSPAFSTIPEAWSECHDDSFRSEFTTLQTYGVRLTVRRSIHDLDECSTDVSVMLLSTRENRSVA